MLGDKEMANDALEMSKVFTAEVTRAAAESTNPDLRDAMLKIRDQAEKEHEKLSKLAIRERWYLPSAQADIQEITRVNSFIEEGQAAISQRQPTSGIQLQ